MLIKPPINSTISKTDPSALKTAFNSSSSTEQIKEYQLRIIGKSQEDRSTENTPQKEGQSLKQLNLPEEAYNAIYRRLQDTGNNPDKFADLTAEVTQLNGAIKVILTRPGGFDLVYPAPSLRAPEKREALPFIIGLNSSQRNLSQTNSDMPTNSGEPKRHSVDTITFSNTSISNKHLGNKQSAISDFPQSITAITSYNDLIELMDCCQNVPQSKDGTKADTVSTSDLINKLLSKNGTKAQVQLPKTAVELISLIDSLDKKTVVEYVLKERLNYLKEAFTTGAMTNDRALKLLDLSEETLGIKYNFTTLKQIVNILNNKKDEEMIDVLERESTKAIVAKFKENWLTDANPRIKQYYNQFEGFFDLIKYRENHPLLESSVAPQVLKKLLSAYDNYNNSPQIYTKDSKPLFHLINIPNAFLGDNNYSWESIENDPKVKARFLSSIEKDISLLKLNKERFQSTFTHSYDISSFLAETKDANSDSAFYKLLTDSNLGEALGYYRKASHFNPLTIKERINEENVPLNRDYSTLLKLVGKFIPLTKLDHPELTTKSLYDLSPTFFKIADPAFLVKITENHATKTGLQELTSSNKDGFDKFMTYLAENFPLEVGNETNTNDRFLSYKQFYAQGGETLLAEYKKANPTEQGPLSDFFLKYPALIFELNQYLKNNFPQIHKNTSLLEINIALENTNTLYQDKTPTNKNVDKLSNRIGHIAENPKHFEKFLMKAEDRKHYENYAKQLKESDKQISKYKNVEENTTIQKPTSLTDDKLIENYYLLMKTLNQPEAGLIYSMLTELGQNATLTLDQFNEHINKAQKINSDLRENIDNNDDKLITFFNAPQNDSSKVFKALRDGVRTISSEDKIFNANYFFSKATDHFDKSVFFDELITNKESFEDIRFLEYLNGYAKVNDDTLKSTNFDPLSLVLEFAKDTAIHDMDAYDSTFKALVNLGLPKKIIFDLISLNDPSDLNINRLSRLLNSEYFDKDPSELDYNEIFPRLKDALEYKGDPNLPFNPPAGRSVRRSTN